MILGGVQKTIKRMVELGKGHPKKGQVSDPRSPRNQRQLGHLGLGAVKGSTSETASQVALLWHT